MITTQSAKSTAADFAALPEGTLAQLIDSELVMTPAPAPEHQSSSIRLSRILLEAADDRGLGHAWAAPLDVHFSETEKYQPDLFIVLNGNPGTTQSNGFHGTPDIVFEILSPSTAYYDLRHKKTIYEQSGVKEYWILDPIEHVIERHTNSPKGFELTAIATKEGSVRSTVLDGLMLDTQQVFANI